VRSDIVLSPKAVKWVSDTADVDEGTAANVRGHLSDFQRFTQEKFGYSIDQTMEDLLGKKLDVYDTLSGFSSWLIREKVNTGQIGATVQNYRVKAVRYFLEAHDVDVNNVKFRKRVKLLKRIKREKVPPEKKELVDLVRHCPRIPLRTLCVFLDALGWRPIEVFWLSAEDIQEVKDPPVVELLGEKAKIPRDRHLYLGKEAYAEYKAYMAWKHRPRRIPRRDPTTGKLHFELVTPEVRKTDLIFAPYRMEPHPVTKKYVRYQYQQYRKHFAKYLDSRGYTVDKRRKRRKITFYSFRRFTYSTIDSLGFHEFAEYYIGHDESTYWEKPEKEKIAMFRKVEPYLTLLDVEALEARNADIESQLQETEEMMKSMRDKHKREIEEIHSKMDEKVKKEVDRKFLDFLKEHPEALAAMREKIKKEKRFD